MCIQHGECNYYVQRSNSDLLSKPFSLLDVHGLLKTLRYALKDCIIRDCWFRSHGCQDRFYCLAANAFGYNLEAASTDLNLRSCFGQSLRRCFQRRKVKRKHLNCGRKRIHEKNLKLATAEDILQVTVSQNLRRCRRNS